MKTVNQYGQTNKQNKTLEFKLTSDKLSNE